jgi:hypothetical protein
MSRKSNTVKSKESLIGTLDWSYKTGEVAKGK